MSYQQFWQDDPQLTVAYREADRLRLQRAEMAMWMNGAYLHDALMRLMPAFHAPYSKQKAEVEPYRSEPIGFYTAPRAEKAQKSVYERERDAAIASVTAIAAKINAKMRKKEA